MEYFSLFGHSKPVIGMLHLKSDSSMGMLEGRAAHRGLRL